MSSVLTSQPGLLSVRVYYEDTDLGGVVYYANYLKFFERGRTEWLRALGINQRRVAQCERLMFVVRNAAVSYQRPARLDDEILIRTTVASHRAATITFDQQASLDDLCLATATVTVCAVHAQTFKPMRIPPSIRNLLDKALF